ncbi:hypothetical protein LOZ55_000841 [Ophidiomyces ophidiicola]|nr:hypothetical protein LOZ55_000841 [Ophidiomyces ophidiicola]
MATSRLPFLYPNLFRLVRSCEPTTYRSLRYPPTQRPSGFHSGPACEQEAYHQRYGPAAEPHLRPPPWSTGKGDILPPEKFPSTTHKRTNDTTQTPSLKDASKQTVSSVAGVPESSSPSAVSVSSTVLSSELPSQERVGGDSNLAGPINAAQASTGNDIANGPVTDALESVFQMTDADVGSSSASSPPAESMSLMRSTASESHRPPHLSPPPYVHHFDSYSLVKDLEKGGFTDRQSTSIMKAVRGILAENLELARQGLISKSDFENETYLFRAACSELRNSIQKSRTAGTQAQRAQRAQLQHEVDILSQKMAQELAGLKDDLKEMFNDQKISSKELQRSQDTGIQELNYQITVSLNSDGKRAVESLRWILTRRAAVAIATSASKLLPFIVLRLLLNCFLVMIIFALRLHSYKQQKGEKQKAAAALMPVIPQDSTFINEASQSGSVESAVAEPMG